MPTSLDPRRCADRLASNVPCSPAIGRRPRMNGRHLSCLGWQASRAHRADKSICILQLQRHPSDQIPMKKLLRITGARIAQLGEPPAVLDDTDLWIADGRILALLPAGTSAPMEGQVETLSFQKALVIPGLINSHSHSASSLLRGCVAGAPLDLFVLDAMARRAPKPMRQVRVGCLLQAT